jgi:leucyl-tRNA synthetase
MMPVTPHLINECLHKIYYDNNVKWPEVEKEFIQSNKSNIVIQINGKKRAILEIIRGTEERDILKKLIKINY